MSGAPRRIRLAFTISTVAAVLVLASFVLPAEYGYDPTGIGARLGIQGMSTDALSALSQESNEYRSDTIEFPLGPFESIEYKYLLAQGQAIIFGWQAEGEVVFDFHSEQAGSDPEDAVSLMIGRSSAQHGTYVAPFAGIHGWSWENRSQETVTVRLQTSGYFKESITYSRAGEYKRQF